MAHETRVKVKRGSNWVDVDELPAIRAAEQEAMAKPIPSIDIDALPHRSALDPDVPFEQLCYEHPEVRYYITANGKIRTGISPEQHCRAEQILIKYGGTNGS